MLEASNGKYVQFHLHTYTKYANFQYAHFQFHLQIHTRIHTCPHTPVYQLYIYTDLLFLLLPGNPEPDFLFGRMLCRLVEVVFGMALAMPTVWLRALGWQAPCGNRKGSEGNRASRFRHRPRGVIIHPWAAGAGQRLWGRQWAPGPARGGRKRRRREGGVDTGA